MSMANNDGSVQYYSSNASLQSSVVVNKEVILAAGTIRTPQLLQVSGIGDPSLLASLNVTTVVDLPAVGQNLHDHVQCGMDGRADPSLTRSNLTTNATFAAETRALYDTQHTGPYTASGGNFIGLLPLTTYSNIASTIQQEASAQDASSYLAAGTPSEVIEGYRAVHEVLTDRLSAPDSALVEFGWRDGGIGTSLQAPFSRGSIRAVSSSTFDAPIVDPRSLHNPLDVVNFSTISELHPVETAPGANVTSDTDLARYVTQNASPAWHLAGSCKMARREEGGVVDEQLKVYGVGNLRIVDASVMPLLPAAHPMTTVYAVAEKAADIIRGRL
ncbi:MAG: hypothetical protein M1820_000585 [Bogoriella megaspora]|nr:MAG: hypothetical protein M1820_000585 [Bogoriella megaspora]